MGVTNTSDPEDMEVTFSILARELAVNYFNVSLRNGPNRGIEELEIRENVTNRIFRKKLEGNEKDFSRNILIIGAGGSKELEFLKDGNQAIDKIEESLQFDEKLLGNPKLLDEASELSNFNRMMRQRFRSLASHYKKTVFGKSSGILTIKAELKFEGRLSMLLNFYDKQNVIDAINNLLNFKYLPCHFYEVVAHMFKHRMIDVIVNFNFDELLDNAIEDEFGPGSYHRIVDDSGCLSLNELMEDYKIKTPIYIKPHGTISSKTSLLFTKEHYIDMSEDMKNLLYSIFMGKVGKEDEPVNFVKKFNIMVAGFALESIELEDILATQLSKIDNGSDDRIDKILYYLFTVRDGNHDSPSLLEKFIDRIKEKVKKEHKNNKRSEPTLYPPIYCNEISLHSHFNKLYEKICDEFKHPFRPVDVLIHKVLFILFPAVSFNALGEQMLAGKIPDDYILYLKNRVVFHVLYELIKGQGKLSLNVLAKERAGKYYREYLKAIKAQQKLDGYASEAERNIPDMINLVNVCLSDTNKKIERRTDDIYEYKHISNFTGNQSIIERDYIIEQMIKNSYNPNVEDNIENFIELKASLDKVFSSIIYEINHIYNDPSHARFNPPKNEQVMLTSLTLTYKFFEYAVLKEENNLNLPNHKKSEVWKKLWFASETGTPVFNLHRYCEKDKEASYLTNFIKEGRKIKILYSHERKIEIDDNTKKDISLFEHRPSWGSYKKEVVSVDIAIGRLKDKHSVEDKVNDKDHVLNQRRPKDVNKNIHHMALFLDESDNPIYGFYFFKPRAKSRINPVFFQRNGPNDRHSNDYNNLLIMRELFKETFPVEEQVIKLTGAPPKTDELSGG
jgi:hypothetical protein